MPSLAQVSVRQVRVLGSKDVVEVEVEATDRIVPQAQVLTGPDRLVVDFPNARPSDQVRSQSVDRGEVKDVRVGLFQSKPPITRIVIDLKSAQSYQLFPSGRTVMIKVVDGPSNVAAHIEEEAPQQGKRPGLVATNYTTHSEPVRIEEAPAPKKALEVSYRDGLLGIVANKATLSEVLYAIQQKTGADIGIPAGAEQEKVVAEYEPAPAPEVLAHLLNGSRFNFLILSAPNDPTKLDRVIFSTRAEGGIVSQPAAQNEDATDDDEPAVVKSQPQTVDPNPAPVPTPPRPEPEQNGPPANQETPDQ
ncbi:MAG TPA: AMIN domain-containing protein [Candidatus Sulfotelmatobacter sp.]|nr:AMIN domain-containing protein [Candidatus Sulfotelmatobacter sp.]